MPRVNRWFMANINGVGGYFFRYLFSNPIPYARTGLDPKRARAIARSSRIVMNPGRRVRPAGSVSDRGGPAGADRTAQLETRQLSVTRAPIAASRDVIVLGAGSAAHSVSAELRTAGITHAARPGREVISSRFDDDTHTWMLRTASGERYLAGSSSRQTHRQPSRGHRSSPGATIFAASRFTRRGRHPGFDPAGKRVAVIGADATAGHYVEQLTESAASVTVFAHAPRRLVTELPLPSTRVKRWLRRRTGPVRGSRGRSPHSDARQSTMTASGIRTRDGVRPPRRRHHLRHRILTPGDPTLVGARGLTIQRGLARRHGALPRGGPAGFPQLLLHHRARHRGAGRLHRECLRSMNDRQHPHRGAAQQPAGVQRARPSTSRPGRSGWHRRSTCRRRATWRPGDLRRRGDADDRRRLPSGTGPAERPAGPDRWPLPLAGNGF